MGTMIGVCFILTMRNVNKNVEAVGKVLDTSFILTMRNVNCGCYIYIYICPYVLY